VGIALSVRVGGRGGCGILGAVVLSFVVDRVGKLEVGVANLAGFETGWCEGNCAWTVIEIGILMVILTLFCPVLLPLSFVDNVY